MRMCVLLVSHQTVGGGQRERTFWRNYFFHCAYTRYEAGLSIDEIWSETAVAQSEATTAVEPEQEETITFDHGATPAAAAATSESTTTPDAPLFNESPAPAEGSPSPEEGSTSNEYEMVDETGDDNAADDADYELDELEAEIARELEED